MIALYCRLEEAVDKIIKRMEKFDHHVEHEIVTLEDKAVAMHQKLDQISNEGLPADKALVTEVCSNTTSF